MITAPNIWVAPSSLHFVGSEIIQTDSIVFIICIVARGSGDGFAHFHVIRDVALLWKFDHFGGKFRGEMRIRNVKHDDGVGEIKK